MIIVRNDCERCGHHRDMHQYGNCVECDKLTQNGVVLPLGTCTYFSEPMAIETGAGPSEPADHLTFGQHGDVNHKISEGVKPVMDAVKGVKGLAEEALKMGRTAKETAAALGLSVEAVTKAFQELRPHMEKAKAEHEKRKEFAMTLKGYIATWIKNQTPTFEKERRAAFSNGYRASAPIGAGVNLGAAHTAYKAWLVRCEIGAIAHRWHAWCAGWNTAREHYKYEPASLHDTGAVISHTLAEMGDGIDGSPIEMIDEDGNSDAKMGVEDDRRVLLQKREMIVPMRPGEAPTVDSTKAAKNNHHILIVSLAPGEHFHPIDDGIVTKKQIDEVCARTDRPTHQELEGEETMTIPRTGYNAEDKKALVESLLEAHQAPWIPKPGDVAYIKGTFEGPFVLLEELDEETVVTFLNPIADTGNEFISAKLPVGTKAWLVQPRTGKPRTILAPLLTDQVPPKGQFFSRCAQTLSSRAFGHLIQAAGFGTLVYLLLR